MISRSNFQNENFNSLDFYKRIKHLDLDLAKEELKSILVNVQQDVEDYVNDQYLNFLSLSRDLEFVEEELQEYAKKLYKILNQIMEYNSKLEKSIHSGQEEFHKIKKEREQAQEELLIKTENFLFKELQKDLTIKSVLQFVELERVSSNVEVSLVSLTADLEGFKGENPEILKPKANQDPARPNQTVRPKATILLQVPELVSVEFKKVIVEPWIQDNFQKSLRKSYSGFLKFCNEISEFVNSIHKVYDGLEFCLWTSAVWPAFIERIDSSVKNPAILDEFHLNYSATIDFILEFEKLYTNLDQVLALRDQSDYKDFLKSWQIFVYYQIRIKEIQADFEKNALLESLETKYGVLTKASFSLLNSIEALWSRNIFLYGLQQKALNATFNFISIFHKFANDTLKEDTIKQEEIYINSLLMLHNDLNLVKEALLENSKNWPIPEIFQPLVYSEIDKLWTCDSIQSEILTKISNLIFLKSNEIIKQVRNIPSQFRGTLKETPTKPSLFLYNILTPISNFKKDYNSNLVSIIAKNVTSLVISRYEETVSETLNSVSNIEAGLRRFKKSKNASEVSDEDKIRKQLEIDSVEFGALISNFSE